MIVVRLLLASIFAVAAIAKLADREGSRRAVRDFGAPKRLAGPLAFALVFAELAIAVALVPGATARSAAAAAAVLLLGFAAALTIALARGRRPDCGCFGRLHSAPAGWKTVARNLALAAVAVLVLSRPATDPRWLELAAAGVAVLVSAQAILSFVLLRRYGRALRRIEELEARPALVVGADAPWFDGLDDLLARGHPKLLVFSEPNCPACRLLEPQIEVWKRELEDRLTIDVVDGETRALYGVEATPSAALVGADGKIAHALVAGAAAIEQLVESLTGDRERESETNGHGRLGAAVALAGAAAVTAAAAHASQQALDPELKAIDDVLKAAGPRLVAAVKRSQKAIVVQATLRTGKAARAKRKAARRALVAQRREVLALGAKVDELPGTTPDANNVKVMVRTSVTLMAQSLKKKERAIGANPVLALKLVKASERLFLRSLASSAAAGKLLGRGQ